jgi:membrane protein YdbS with pleckstrin-like domain
MSEQLKQVAFTILRVFFATVLAQAVLDLVNLMDFHWADWKPIVVSGVAAVIAVVIVAINPADARYGLGVNSGG